MLCPICQSPLSPVFTSLVCPNSCDPRELTVAEALYNATLGAAAMQGVWNEPWDEIQAEAKEFFLNLARVAIKAFNS
jgi:hypothetical protein